jgi:serine phosphatase RsbU (regulator of sigma subunit)
MFLNLKWLPVFLALFLCGRGFSQFAEFSGSYPVFNYSNDEFNSPVQIWSGCQTEYGEFVFGNDERIIRFNGFRWSFVNSDTTFFPQEQRKNSSIHNSRTFDFLVASDKQIYVTRVGSFGKLVYNKKGIPVYQPLLVSDNVRGGWKIEEVPSGEIYFLNVNSLFIYNPKSQEVKELDVPETMRLSVNLSMVQLSHGLIISSTHTFNDSLSKVDGKGALYFFSFSDQKFRRLSSKDWKVWGYNVRSYIQIGKQHYLAEQNFGLIPIRITDNGIESLEEKHPFSELNFSINKAVTRNGVIWLATEKNGLVVVSENGKVLRNFNTSEGVIDSHVYDFFFDQIGNLWLTLDNGISVVELSSDVMFWTKPEGLDGKIESIAFKNGAIYIASRSGFFSSYKELEKFKFNRNRDIDEETFDLLLVDESIGNKALVIGYNGIYSVDLNTGKADPVAYGIYAWKLLQDPKHKNRVLVGGEGFLGELIYVNGKWNYNTIKNYNSDIRFLLADDKGIYFSVQGVGVHIMSYSGKIELVPMHNKYEIDNSNFFLVKWDGHIYAGTTKGLYVLNNNAFEMVHAEGLNIATDHSNIHRLFSDEQNKRLWAFVIEEYDESIKYVGYLTKQNGGGYSWTHTNNALLEKGLISGMNVYDDVLFFASNKGVFGLKTRGLDEKKQVWNVYISSIFIDDTLASGIPGLGFDFPELSYHQSISFNLFSSVFNNGGQMLFRTRLIGFKEEWSAFEAIESRKYEKLPAGTYTFEVQGKDLNNHLSEIYRFSFVVLPPWYLTWWAYVLYGLGGIGIIILSSFLSVQRVKSQNRKLEILVTERTQEISEKNTILEKQKDEIQAKTEDILDSIKYAKRLQDTILPNDEFLSNQFTDHFVFYRPKDIVSGDFYWARKFDEGIIWAVADCTGHGVPGAMVSIVGNNGLLRATNEFKLREPAEILNRLRSLVLESFKAQGANDVKDGMDMTLAKLNRAKMKLSFSGANNSLVLIRNGEITDFKGDKQPIGDFEYRKDFTQVDIDVQPGDAIYMFSDGYVDQFGGDTQEVRLAGGKKFKSKAFKDLLAEIYLKPMSEQHDIIVERFDLWRGELEQIDDVCVFGVRI